jgi:hypothetical protein
MFATNMAEPAQQAASSKICSISITAFAADPTSRCCAGFVYGFPAGCRVPTPGAANVTPDSRPPDDATFNDLRKLGAICDHRGADVGPSRLHHG